MEQIEKIQGTEKEFIKVFQELCYSRSSWQVWADLMTAMACTLANSVDKTEPRYTAREKEYTGRYYEPLALQLSQAGLFVSAVNPKLIKDYNRNSLRKVKSDKVDAIKIARYALDSWSELKPYSPIDEIRNQLKIMNRQFSFYMKHKTAMKNNLIGILDQTYPGVNSYFDSSARADGSQNIKQAVEQLNTVSRTVEELRALMNEMAAKLPEYPIVMAMKGVGPSLGPQLMAEIGDVTRFTHKTAITAFAGVDPGVNQSGSYEQRKAQNSKKLLFTLHI